MFYLAQERIGGKWYPLAIYFAREFRKVLDLAIVGNDFRIKRIDKLTLTNWQCEIAARGLAPVIVNLESGPKYYV
jgi:hypothetical protein